ncbi:MAG: hypothetical protein ABH848_02990 [Candidatus Omnitrophota bacterium]
MVTQKMQKDNREILEYENKLINISEKEKLWKKSGSHWPNTP